MIKIVRKNILTIITASVIMFLSMAQSDDLNKVDLFGLKHFDKFVHMSMYFGLMLVLLYEHNSSVKKTRDSLILAVLPLIYGILIEFLQAWLTVSRQADLFDALANLTGILLCLSLWNLIRIYRKNRR